MFTNITQFRSLIDIILKFTGILVASLYVFFALVIIRQIGAMKKVVELHDNGLLLLASYIQLIVAIVLLLYSLFVL